MEIGTISPRGKGMKRQSEGHRSRSHEAGSRLGGLAEASFSTHWARAAVLVLFGHVRV